MDGLWAQPSITMIALFAAMILAPTTLYFYLAHPDWSWLYLVDPARIPKLLVVSLVAVKAAALLGGYGAGVKLVRLGRDKVALYAAGGGFGLLTLLAFLLRHRLFRYASYEQFHQGFAISLGEVKLGYVLVAVTIGTWASIAFVGWELVRDGRRAASR